MLQSRQFILYNREIQITDSPLPAPMPSTQSCNVFRAEHPNSKLSTKATLPIKPQLFEVKTYTFLHTIGDFFQYATAFGYYKFYISNQDYDTVVVDSENAVVKKGTTENKTINNDYIKYHADIYVSSKVNKIAMNFLDD
jgi:hypothetical protein